MDEAEKAIGGCFTVIAVIAVVTLVLALPVMWLWNALCPELFHLPEITF